MGDSVFALQWWQWILLAGVLLIIAAHTLQLHVDYSGPYRDPRASNDIIIGNHTQYPFPYHADEWIHLAYATFLINEHYIPTFNPYVQYANHVNIEAGVSTFAALFFLLTGFDPVLSYQYLPTITIVLVGLALFLFTLFMTRRYAIALMAPLLLFFIRSNNLSLGFWFFVPATFGLFFILTAYATYLARGRMRWLTLFIFIVTLFTYPLASVMIALGILCMELYLYLSDPAYRKSIQHRFKHSRTFLIIIGIGILLLFAVILVVFHGKLSQFPLLISYDQQAGSLASDYNPLTGLGIPLMLLAFVGIYTFIRKKYTLFLLGIVGVLMGELLLFASINATIMIPAARAYFYLLVFLIPLSAAGIVAIADWACLRVKQQQTMHHVVAVGTMLLILAIILALQPSMQNPTDSLQTPLQLTEMKDYYALLWIRNNYPQNTMMMVDAVTAPISYPIAYTQIVALPFSAAGAGDVTAIPRFYNGASTCAERKQVLLSVTPVPKLVYSMTPLRCDFLREVYNKERYVYEVQIR